MEIEAVKKAFAVFQRWGILPKIKAICIDRDTKVGAYLSSQYPRITVYSDPGHFKKNILKQLQLIFKTLQR